MRTGLIAYLFALSVVVSAQGNKFRPPYYFCNWTNVSLNNNYIPSHTDTCLFVVSTRNYNATKKEFVDYDLDTAGTLSYFALYFKGNNWIAVNYASLKELLDSKNNLKNFVIFTEGLGKTFTAGIDRTTRLTREYDVDVLYFDWPTERPYMRSGKNIKTTCRIAPKVAISYAGFLEEFQTYKNAHINKFKVVTLFFHSMGNLLLMYDLKYDLFKNISPTLAHSVILNAACVNQTGHKAWLEKLSVSDQIYLTINNKDRNLRGARILFGDHQLGAKPKPEFCKSVKYVDFSDVLGSDHNYYVMQPLLSQKPSLKQFYADIFAGKIPQLKFLSAKNIISKN